MNTQRGVTSRWGIPPDPNLSFSSARRKELKEASTPSKASPYMGRMQHEKSQKPTTFLRFGIAGHAIYFLSWLAPKGQRLCEPYQNLDVGRSLPGGNYIPLPKIGEGLGEWSEAPSYEEGVGVDGGLQAFACNGAFSFFEALRMIFMDEVVDGVVEGQPDGYV